MVAGVDQSFVESLMKLRATQQHRAPLRVLSLHRCPNLHLRKAADFEWIQAMLAMGLEVLDFTGCDNVNSKVLRKSCEGRRWTATGLLRVVYPDQGLEETQSLDRGNLVSGEKQEMKWGTNAGEQLPAEDRIEVDPAYAASG